MTESLHYLSVAHLQARLRSRDLTVVDVIEACLERIELLNPRLNAFITVMSDSARMQAKDADAEMRVGKWRGPLHGIPVAIKDFFDTANVRTTAAFEAFKYRMPARDAVAVDRLKRAGAVVVGKTNMHQLGMGTTGLDSCFGAVRNPWNDAFIPGGSSSGSAAAVAAGLCGATLDTDAIGSCRLPAACCGVVGFKGTYGAISGKGILEGERADPAVLWLSHPAITARTVDDAAMLFDVLADREQMPAIASPRIGIARNAVADAEIAAAFDAAVATIQAIAHQMVRVDAPLDTPRFGDLGAIEADRKSIADRAFTDVDIIVLPTLATTVLSVAAAQGKPQSLAPANTVFANYFGLPALTLPCGFDRRGLPIGLQIVGKPWDEATVLAFARRCEAALGGTKHPIP